MSHEAIPPAASRLRRPSGWSGCLVAVAGLLLSLAWLQAMSWPCGWSDRLLRLSGCRQAFTIEGRVTSLAFSPDGRLLALAPGSHPVQLRWVADGSVMRALDAQPAVASLAFSTDGARLAAGTWDGSVEVWQVADGAPLRSVRVGKDGRTRAALSPDGSVVAAGNVYSATAGLWRVADGERVGQFPGKNDTTMYDVAFSPDGALVAVGGDGGVGLWRVEDGSLLRVLAAPPIGVSRITFSPDGSRLAAALRDSSVRLWAVPTGEMLRALPKHTVDLNGLAFSPDGTLLATGGIGERAVRLWRVADGRQVGQVRGHLDLSHGFQSDIEALTFSPDGMHLAFAASTSEGEFTTSTVRLWRVR